MKLVEDIWAMKAIHYLARKNYSTSEIVEQIAKMGIQLARKAKERANAKSQVSAVPRERF